MKKLYKYSFNLNASHSFKNGINIHSHTFKITLFIELMDEEVSFNEYEKMVNDYLELYRGKYLNNIDPFNKISPTLENMAKVFYDKINEILLDCSLDLRKLEIGDGYTVSTSLGEILISGSNNRIISDAKFSFYKEKILNKYNIVPKNESKFKNYSFTMPIFERKFIEVESFDSFINNLYKDSSKEEG